MLISLLTLIDSEADQLRFCDIYDNYRKQMLLAAKRVLHNEDDATVKEALQEALKNDGGRRKPYGEPACMGVFVNDDPTAPEQELEVTL